MNNEFKNLIAELAKVVSMTECSIQGEKFARVATLTPKADGKERLLYWSGADPEPSEIPKIVRDLIVHLSLRLD